MTSFALVASVALREKLADFAHDSGLWDIVRDSIIAYDNKDMERLIRSVANRELFYITILGGVLGGLIGLLQPLLLRLLGS